MTEGGHSTDLVETDRVALSCRFTVIIIQQSTEPLTPLYSSSRFSLRSHRHDQPVPKTLMVTFQCTTNSRMAFRNESSPKKIIRSRQLSLMLRTNRSASGCVCRTSVCERVRKSTGRARGDRFLTVRSLPGTDHRSELSNFEQQIPPDAWRKSANLPGRVRSTISLRCLDLPIRLRRLALTSGTALAAEVLCL
jgi:hypothetical protein